MSKRGLKNISIVLFVLAVIFFVLALDQLTVDGNIGNVLGDIIVTALLAFVSLWIRAKSVKKQDVS